MAEENIIDWELSVSLANGNEVTAKQLLKLLITQLPDNKKELQRYYQANNLNALCDLVHKLHGASCYCGVPQLKAAAHELEEALQTKQLGQLNTMFNTFITAIDDVLTAAAEIVEPVE